MDGGTLSGLLQANSEMCKYLFHMGKAVLFFLSFTVGKWTYFQSPLTSDHSNRSRGHCGKPQLNLKLSLLGTIPVLWMAPSLPTQLQLSSSGVPFSSIYCLLKAKGLPLKPLSFTHPQNKLNAKIDTSFPSQSPTSGPFIHYVLFLKKKGEKTLKVLEGKQTSKKSQCSWLISG